MLRSVVLQMTLITPSANSAIANVTSTLSWDRSSRRNGRRNKDCTPTPTTNMTTVVIGTARNGSRPNDVNSWKDRYAPRITMAPWAMLMTFMMPKISVWPDAISAYTPAVSTPRMMPWTKACIRSPTPAGFGCLRGGLGDRLRVDRQQLALDPLHEVELPVGRAVDRPGQVAQDGRPDAGVQRADDRRVVDLAGLRRNGGDHLAHRVGLGAAVIDALRGAAELLDVGRGERRAARSRGAGEPVGRRHDALGVRFAHLVREVQRRVGAVGLEHELGVVLELHQVLDLGVRVLVLGAADDKVRMFRDHRGHHRREVHRLGRVDLLVDRLDAGGLQLGPDVLGERG